MYRRVAAVDRVEARREDVGGVESEGRAVERDRDVGGIATTAGDEVGAADRAARWNGDVETTRARGDRRPIGISACHDPTVESGFVEFDLCGKKRASKENPCGPQKKVA